ncbi:MAG: hypothetical protein KDD62_08485, partial [Bdellovibrionales bacterium]|nr:hypothetical protein [Bdellovibrionales bacterium]
APDQYTTPQCWYDINAKAENYLDRVLIQYDFTNMEGHPLAFLQTRSAAIARMIQNTGQATTATPILSPNTKLTLPVHFNPESYIIHTDKNCNVIENPTEWEKNEACDAAVYYRGRSSCPVSLLWEEGTDIEHGVVVRNFKLDLEAEGEWTEWKASGAAPLLVDLSKGTKITSATQLIGNWTFGGMPHASLQSQQTRGTKWRDGFAVLEYLDADQSGELSGTELKNLGLWFDFNRNAVSDEGEVKTLAEAMVSRLFYQGSREDTNGNITLEIGYERVNEQGATLKGASIDWYGTVGPNKSAVEVFTSAQTSK